MKYKILYKDTQGIWKALPGLGGVLSCFSFSLLQIWAHLKFISYFLLSSYNK